MRRALPLLVVACLALPIYLSSQTVASGSTTIREDLPQWVQMMYAAEPDLDQVLAAFKAHYEEYELIKNEHTQYLKRLLRERETYAFQLVDADLSEEERLAATAAERRYRQAWEEQQLGRSGSWNSIGPYDWDHDAAGRSYAPGAAHVYTVEMCLNDPSVLYAGTATAGMWQSTDGGNNWTSITADLMVNQVYAIEIDPTGCNRILAAMMGGIFSSVNGGNTWTETGDAAFQALDLATDDIKFAPGSSTIVWAATNNGLFRSTNSGSSWIEVMSGAFQEIEFHPTNSSIMYIIRQVGDLTEFYRSTDSGATFVQQTTGWPVPAAGDENKRAEIAVSEDAPNRVYALLTGQANGGSGLYGVYRSDDSGATWSFNCCGPQPGGPATLSNINMMGWSDVGTDNGGQYYYDLGLAVSQQDADRVYVAGVNLWVSDDGGNSFTCPAKWSHPYKPNYVHADIHDVNAYANGDIWLACDGGIFYSNNEGADFDRSMTGITGSDFWGFGVGFNNDELMLGGAYHNGTLLKNGTVYDNEWVCMDGGDGVGGAVHPILENQVYSDRNIKTMPDDRNIEPATRGYALEPSWTYVSGRFSQIEFASDNYNVHYFGNGDALFKTENDNQTVTQVHDFGEEVGDVEVAWGNSQIIYVATFPSYWGAKKIYRSADGGLSWTEITPAATASSGVPYDVEVSYNDPDVIWAARIGRSTGSTNKVLRSTNGGTSWTDITNIALDGEVLTNVIAQRGTNDRLYLGTTRTVYTSSNGTGGWQLFADGLPASTRSRQLAISYRNGTLINATNRSVWVSGLAQSNTVTPQIAVDKYYSGCARDTFKFADHSAVGNGASYQWSFPGATWVSSTTARDPEVVYGLPGQYSVSLTISGQTQTLNNLVEVGDECSPDPFAGRALFCNSSSQHFRSSTELEVSTNTMTLMAWIRPDGIQDDYTGIIFNDDAGAGINLRPNNELGYHWTGGSTHWAWSSGLTVPTDEWSFVAMVITPNSVTFYLNEEEVTRNFGSAISPVFWGRFRVGSYQGWTSRNFRGDIDEAIIWQRALSQDEIREWRHLVKYRQATPGEALYDSDLIAYLQFNETSGQVYDRAGVNHGFLNGNATRVPSRAPIGDGSSSRQTVNGAGTYNFTDERLQLVFPSGGAYPNEELVVTRLNNAPHLSPNNPFNANTHWIVNNYGSETFTELSSIEFSGLTGVTGSAFTNPEQFVLYKRPSNADEAPWGDFIDQADMAATGGRVTFSTDNGISSFSQLALGQEAIVVPVSFVDLWLKENAGTVDLTWETAQEEEADYFIVERSKDGQAFVEIERVSARNLREGSQYATIDKTPYSGLNFYRIRAVDFAGHEDFSPIRSIQLLEAEEWGKVYPNPLNVQTGLQVRSSLPGPTRFELYSADGRLLQQTIFESNVYLRLPGLPAGMYNYRLVNQGEILTGQLVKQ
ncbi:MAG: LamG-like jellyroll fold domain-containing protein [Bacteroidota bacterium]